MWMRVWISVAWVGILGMGCGEEGSDAAGLLGLDGDSDGETEGEGDSDGDTDSDEPAAEDDSGSPADTGAEMTPTIVCTGEPPTFTLQEPLPGPKANRTLAIGGPLLMGWDGQALFKADSTDSATLLTPSITAYGGMFFLPNGDLITSEHLGTENLNKVSPDGSRVVLASGLRAYGVVPGPDGMIYATSERGTLYRVDPLDGALEALIAFPDESRIRLSDFSPEGDRLYIGTMTEEGLIFALDLDEDYNPVGEPWVFASTPGWFHDMLVVDACGNLLVTVFYGSSLYWISPEGEVVTLAELTPEQHIHGGAWGAGVGAWDDHTLYLAHPQLGNVVSTWAYGIPGRNYRDGEFETCDAQSESCGERDE